MKVAVYVENLRALLANASGDEITAVAQNECEREIGDTEKGEARAELIS